MAKVFIGMPAYNAEKFIGKTIESFQKQTYTDWKLLISDDESSDNTKGVCEAYAQKDSRITYYRRPKNEGHYANFKYLLDQADGEYFMWAGHDDFWDKDFLSVCVDNFKKYPDRGVSFTGQRLIHTDGSTAIEYSTFPSLSGPKNIFTVARFVLQPEILGKTNMIHALYKIECIRKAFAYYPHQPAWGSDAIFSLAAISHCGVIIDKRVLFSKKLGGYSDPEKMTRKIGEKIVIANPKNHIFPIGGHRFSGYFRGHMQALKNTPYKIPVAILLLIRSIRAVILFIKPRVIKKLGIGNV
jgi:glycosyltransferase involved in cell wall biosynthesis